MSDRPITKEELIEWYELSDAPLNSWEYQELIRLNHLVMEVAHAIHNNNMMKDRRAI